MGEVRAVVRADAKTGGQPSRNFQVVEPISFTAMNLNTPQFDVTARRLACMAIGLSVCGLILVAVSAINGGPVRWWHISQPTLIIAMVAAMTFGRLKRAPREQRLFNIASMCVALVGLVAVLMSFRT